jgi:signal transduction histidine kinase
MDTTALVPAYTPPQPANEKARLQALERYKILDTAPEEAFENIVEVATIMFDAPIGLITFLDESRQWFKAKRGINLTSSDRRIAFCASTILESHGLIVPDTLDDPRFRYNPFVSGAPYLRFYGGVPLVSADGYAMGSLGVADVRPRHDSGAEQLVRLTKLAKLVMDQVELRLLQARLRSEKQKLQFAMTNAGMGHWMWDMSTGDFELPNTIASLLTRHDHPVNIGLHEAPEDFLELVHGHDRARIRRLFIELRHKRVPISATFRIVLHDEVYWVEVSADYSPDDPQLIIGTARDVTDTERLRNQALRADRLHALSRLGAGVAHEINNPLSVISTNLYLLATWYKRNREWVTEKDREYVDKLISMAQRGAERVEHVVDAMLELSRPEETGEERTDPRAVLESVVHLVQSEVPPDCALHADLEQTPTVRGRASTLTQVFVSLLVNAIDAVESSPPRPGGHSISVKSRPQGLERVLIEISDTGPGLGAEQSAQIFNPFFTTKSPGKGTGLGLAIAHSIVDSLGGEITIETCNGYGTSARVSLPVDRRPLAAKPTENRPFLR